MAGPTSKSITRGTQYVSYVSVNPDFEERLVDELGKINIIMKPVTESQNFAPYPRLIFKYIENADDYLKEMETLNDVIAKLHARDVLVLILTLAKSPPEMETSESQNKEELRSFKRIVAQKAKTLAIAYDRSTPDTVLDAAKDFVEKELNIQLLPVENVQESPLLVFCKNDSQVQDDIDIAKKRTRAGEDVMLLVVTASDNLRLVDTKATEGFGSKAKLKWESHRKQFSREENHECIECVQNFLQRYGFDVTLRLRRKDSIKSPLKNLKQTKTVGIAYDRATPDTVLDAAKDFVEKELNIVNIQLVHVENVQETPLLVFCKNDSNLQDDIDNAKKSTRAGEDVMLLVVTASDNLRLVDTKATEGFGSKAKLKWDFHRQQFLKKENHECIECVQHFLQRFGFDVTLPHGRKDSMKQSFRNLRQRFNHTLPDVSGKMENDLEKSNTGKQNIIPQRKQSRPKPLIVFKTDKELTEKYIPCFNQFPVDSVLLMEPRDSLRVVHLCSNTNKAIKMSNINIERIKVPMAEANLPSKSKTVEKDKSATPFSKECSVKNDDDKEEDLNSVKNTSSNEVPSAPTKVMTQCGNYPIPPPRQKRDLKRTVIVHINKEKIDEGDKQQGPTGERTESPTEKSTKSPTEKRTESPTEKSTKSPTEKRTESPTEIRTESPTGEEPKFLLR